VSGSNGQACPECSTPRRPDGTPSCECTRRASDALRDARTAQAAAAEDFDPLRIRPYVDLPVTMSGTEAPPAPAPRDAAPDETVPLAAVPEETPGRHAPASDQRQRRHAVSPNGASRRRRRAVLVAAGAVVTVGAAVAFASGLFSYDPPQRDGALPENIRESVPEESQPGKPSAATSTASAATPSASATTLPSMSPTPSAPPTSAPPSPSAPATPSASPTTTRPASPATTPGRDQPVQALRPGDRGPEVTGLQLRLGQLHLYGGPTNGNYNWKVERSVRRYQEARGITQDEPGVYGAATRAQLESETSAP